MKNIDPALLAQLKQELMAEIQVNFPALQRAGNSDGAHGAMGPLALNAPTDRRSMLKTVGALAVGVAAVGLLKPTSASAGARTKNAPATTGNPVILGMDNSSSGDDTTSIFNPTFQLQSTILRVDNYGDNAAGQPVNGAVALSAHGSDVGTGTTGQDIYAVNAVAEATAGGTGYGVYSKGTNYGVYGVASAAANIGVYGEATGNGCGVSGNCTGATNGWGVDGNSDIGVGGQFAGGRCALYLNAGAGSVANPNVTAPAGSSIGDVYRSLANGSVWYNAGGANPYRKLAGSETAGAVHILAAPVRYVDTRNGTGGAASPFTNGQVRSYNFVSLQPGTIPQGARGVFGNISAVTPGGNGNFQNNTANSFPAGSAAVMNFATNVNLSNHFVGGLDTTGQLFIKGNVFTGSGQVHLVIDIQGYFI